MSDWRNGFAPHFNFPAVGDTPFRHLAGSNDPLVQIRYLARLGMAGVGDNNFVLRSATEQTEIGRALAHHGMALGSIGLGEPAQRRRPLIGLKDAQARSTFLDLVRQAVAAARRAGGRGVTIVTGRDPNAGAADQLARMADDLRDAADLVAGSGVSLNVELTSPERAPGMLVESLADALELVRSADHPGVRLVFDVVHVALQEPDLLGALHRSAPLIAAIQLGDLPGRLEPGSGNLKLADVIRGARDFGYSGLFELEHAYSRPGEAGERLALKRLKALDEATI